MMSGGSTLAQHIHRLKQRDEAGPRIFGGSSAHSCLFKHGPHLKKEANAGVIWPAAKDGAGVIHSVDGHDIEIAGPHPNARFETHIPSTPCSPSQQCQSYAEVA